MLSNLQCSLIRIISLDVQLTTIHTHVRSCIHIYIPSSRKRPRPWHMAAVITRYSVILFDYVCILNSDLALIRIMFFSSLIFFFVVEMFLMHESKLFPCSSFDFCSILLLKLCIILYLFRITFAGFSSESLDGHEGFRGSVSSLRRGSCGKPRSASAKHRLSESPMK